MSWIDRIENIELEIQTGDGRIYKPLWKNAQKEISFNTQGFDFVGQNGTYVDRNKKRGDQYPVLLYFQGENNIEESANFLISAADPRPWYIRHPYYDNISVQPISLKIDNSSHNLTVISGILWETIDLVLPNSQPELFDINVNRNNDISELSANTFSDNVVPVAATGTLAGNAVGQLENALANLPQTPDEIQAFQNLVREATGAAESIVASTERYAQSTNALINFPFQSTQDVLVRVRALGSAYDNLRNLFGSGTTEDIQFFESQGAAVLGALCVTALGTGTKTADYTSRSEVLEAIDTINAKYADFVAYFDSFGYIGDPVLAQEIDQITANTAGQLLEVAFNAKQERSEILNYPANIITLAHKYFGVGETALANFMAINEITRQELLQVPAGREIRWYV